MKVVGSPAELEADLQPTTARTELTNLVARDFRGVIFAMEHAKRAAIAFRGLDLEVTGDERDEIGRQRLGLSELHYYSLGAIRRPDCLDVGGHPRYLGAVRR